MPLTVAQIDVAYQGVLQRAPTDAEVTASQSLDATVGDSAAIAAIIDFPEAQQNVYPILEIILRFAHPAAAAAQLPTLVPAVESGSTSLDQVALPVVASTEFAQVYNGGTVVDPNAPITAPIVSAIIRDTTGLAATPDQISAWVNTGLSIDQVFVDFVLSTSPAVRDGEIQDILGRLAENPSYWGPIDYFFRPNDDLTATQVQGAYQAVLQRAPSIAETNAALWTDSSTLGGAGNVGALAVIVDSPEAQQNVYPVVQIIELATGNVPTGAQLSGWVQCIESAGLLQGQSQTNPLLDQMAEAFVASAQFGDTYNGGTAVDPNAPITAPIVSAIVQAATGVAATQAQITGWVGTGLSIDQVFVDFSLGDQYTTAIQVTVQDFLTAAAINGAGLSTVDGAYTTGATLTLGTVQTPLIGNDLTIQGGFGSLTVVAIGNGDTITEPINSTAGGMIIASGNNDTISVASGANTITATGAGDTINLGVTDAEWGTSINTAQTVHTSGAFSTISFATTTADGTTAITWSGVSTVDGGDGSTGIGPNSTVSFGNNTNGGMQTIFLTGDLTGATTQNGTTLVGIVATTLENVHDAARDQIVFNNATTEVLAGIYAANVSGAGSLPQALDMAVADAAASQSGGQIGAHTGVINWFQYAGDTYLVEAINNTANSSAHMALAAGDAVVLIVGTVDLSGETLAGHTLTF
jgi:hypothetical protein